MGRARKRSHGTGTVFARSNGRYTAQITDVDGRRSIGTFASRSAAERALAKALVDGPPPSIDLTFGESLTDWLEDQSLLLKATTSSRNRSIVKRYVLCHRIACLRVRDLASKDFRALYRELAEHGKADGTGLAAGSIATVDQLRSGSQGCRRIHGSRCDSALALDTPGRWGRLSGVQPSDREGSHAFS